MIGATLATGRTFWKPLLILNTLWLAASATLVLAPPATLALFHCAYEIMQGRSTAIFSTFRQAMQLYLAPSWNWALINFGAAVLLYANVRFYGQLQTSWGAPLQLIALVVGAAWVTVQLYTLAYLMALEQLLLRTALRNGLFTLLASPLYSLILTVIVVGIGYLCLKLIVILFIGVPALIALLGTYAVRERLRAFKLLPDSAPDQP